MFDYTKLTNDEKVRKKYTMNVKNRFQILEDNNSTSFNYINLKGVVVGVAKESIPTKKMEKNEWMTCGNLGSEGRVQSGKAIGSMKYDEPNRKIR